MGSIINPGTIIQKESMIGFLLFRHRFSCCKGLLLKPKRNKNTSVSKTALVHKVEWNPPPFLVGYISLLSDVQVKSDVSSNADAVESLLLLSGMGSPPHSHPQPPDSVRPRASSMSFLQPTASSSLSSLAPNAPSVNLSTSPSSSASTSSSTDQVPSPNNYKHYLTQIFGPFSILNLVKTNDAYWKRGGTNHCQHWWRVIDFLQC